jgi:hypothetical protein
MEEQPNSRMCFVCRIENPIGLKLKFYTDDEGRSVAQLRPKPEHQGHPGQLHGGSSSRYWTSQLKFPYSLAFSLYDRVLLLLPTMKDPRLTTSRGSFLELDDRAPDS